MDAIENNEYSISKIQKGDRAEFAKLMNSHSSQVYRIALKMLNNPQDAEDVLQNTFLKAMQNITGFEGRSSVSTWLFRIATNESLMMIRKRRPEVDIAEPVDDESIHSPIQLIDWCCLPESEFLSNEVKMELDKAMQGLTETLRIVFILRDIEHLSIYETSQVLNITETAVKTRLLRARLYLREHLSAYFGDRLQVRSMES
jgi:RNA polymerase sigma-70 factor (ECF subfamily)